MEHGRQSDKPLSPGEVTEFFEDHHNYHFFRVMMARECRIVSQGNFLGRPTQETLGGPWKLWWGLWSDGDLMSTM